jgi:hypothetical protein
MKYYDEFSYGRILSSKTKLPNQEKSINSLIIISRYYLDIGLSLEDIESRITKITTNSYDGLSSGFIKSTVQKAISLATQMDNLIKKSIWFSKDELEFIHSYNNEQLERLIFVMMCVYKYNECYSFSISRRFINAETKLNKDSNALYRLFNILEKEKLFESKMYQGNIYYEAGEKIKNLCSQCEKTIEITNTKNIVYYYLRFLDDGIFFECENCGCIDKKNSNMQKYCKDCSLDVRRKNVRKAVKKHSKLKTNTIEGQSK